jgi:hypothetical protein
MERFYHNFATNNIISLDNVLPAWFLIFAIYVKPAHLWKKCRDRPKQRKFSHTHDLTIQRGGVGRSSWLSIVEKEI